MANLVPGSLTGDEHIRDPFAQSGYTHPAIRETCATSSDIYRDLFDSIFSYGAFDEWSNGTHSWQLHCNGGPGAGKTTFAALAVERIREKFAGRDGCVAHVASIFIHDSAVENDLVFLEDLLYSVYRQLIRSALPVGHTVSSPFEKYDRARKAGSRTATRISLITRALRQRVLDLEHGDKAFLVIDNIDRCSSSLRELLERELLALQDAGLNIFITSRLPRHGPIGSIVCSFHEENNPPTEVYWCCSTCDSTHICVDCYKEIKHCEVCGDRTEWIEPDHIKLNLNSIYKFSIWDFIKWDLEREHGDLGLGSNYPNKPPLSPFGMAFRDTKSGAAGQEWVMTVTDSCSGSISQAKLALDRIHNSPTPEAYELVPHRIPYNVQAMFEKGLRSIAQQPTNQRDIALKSMAAVGKQGHVTFGLPLSELAVAVRERPHASTNRVPPRSVEDILVAAKGYLMLIAPKFDDDDEYTLGSFHSTFFQYIWEDYNDDIVMANAQLNTALPPRSSTWALPRLDSLEDVLERDRIAKSPELRDPFENEPAAARKGSLGLMRSSTFMSPVASRVPSPPKGLGLMFDPSAYLIEE